MEISHSTVPGVGVLHECTVRDGGYLEILARRDERRELIVHRRAGGLDEPLGTIVLDPDEADQIADILHSRPIPDRLAALERRLLELTGRPR